MRKVLRPFANAITLGPHSVPRGPLRIDWTHPLSRGLIFACVPGANTIDVTGSYAMPNIDVGDSYIETIEGISLKSGTISAATPTSVMPGAATGSTQPFSFYWRGLAAGTAGNTAYIYGSWQSSEGNVIYTITAGTSGWASAPQLWWRTVNTNQHFAMTSNPTASGLPKIISLGGTFPPGGTVTAYANGLANGTSAFNSTSGPNANGTQGISFASPNTTTGHLVGYVWNRILDPYEMAWIDRDPYRPFMSYKPEMSILQAQAGPATIFRKTASKIGTRTGSRQTWAA